MRGTSLKGMIDWYSRYLKTYFETLFCISEQNARACIVFVENCSHFPLYDCRMTFSNLCEKPACHPAGTSQSILISHNVVLCMEA